MKANKLFYLCLLPLMISSLSGCNKGNNSSPTEDSSSEEEQPKGGDPLPSDANLPTTISYLDEPGVQIHYQRTKKLVIKIKP